jgi:hypothetical protein
MIITQSESAMLRGYIMAPPDPAVPQPEDAGAVSDLGLVLDGDDAESRMSVS